MKLMMKKLEAIFSAIAFAEAGEADVAKEILDQENCKERPVGTRGAGCSQQVVLTTAK